MVNTKSKPKTRRPETFDHLKSKKKPLRREVIIPGEDAPVEEYEKAVRALERAEVRNEAEEVVDACAARVASAIDALREASAVFVMQSIGRKALRELIEAHPPSDAQMKEWEKEAFIIPTNDDIAEAAKNDKPLPKPIRKQDAPPEPAWNFETYPRALMAASCIDPVMTEDQVQELDDEWNAEETLELWMAALEVNSSKRSANWGKE